MASHSIVQSSFPVLLPELPECYLSTEQFKAHLDSVLPRKDEPVEPTRDDAKKTSSFVEALVSPGPATIANGKMLTANGDEAYADTGESCVNLFHELEDVVETGRLRFLLQQAWKDDPTTTLKIIWNSRSIHLGKSSRTTFYRAVGWLLKRHPATLLHNLPWLVRPVIQKKVPQEPEDKDMTVTQQLVKDMDLDSDYEMVDEPVRKKVKLDIPDVNDEFDIKYGVTHGYWKDLLNMLALALNDKLGSEADIHSVLGGGKINFKSVDWTEGRKKTLIPVRHEQVIKKLDDKVYRALHATIAKLFADQLKLDLARLKSGHPAHMKRISMAAKWAPTNKGMHDCNTFIASTIAELLYPFESVVPKQHLHDRSICLKYARLAYQARTLAPLRKHLDIVERHISDQTFHDIQYNRVPSLAMRRYTKLFSNKDNKHFMEYLYDVAAGKAAISGATLLPSTLVADASGYANQDEASKLVRDSQWKTLVQRVKDSGTMESAMAVCDVSGSMFSPQFRDKTCPLHSAIGLSLLLAEVCKAPFGGHFITFSENPEVVKAGGEDDKRTFTDKVGDMQKADWGMSTNFEAVFTKCILPRARKYKVKPEDMVKRVFVFSDMHFNAAGAKDWRSTYKRIKAEFKLYRYAVPELVFWNLAGGAQGGVAPKSVKAHQEGTALVNGYSQAMMKVFMDGGSFEDVEEEVVLDKQGNEVKPSMTPMAILKKAVSHDAYRMLKVYD